MKTLAKSILAVTGLTLSVACAPAFKGEGVKKPNLQREARSLEKMMKEEAEAAPNIKSISLGESDEDEILVKLELANVGGDLTEKQLKVDAMLAMKDDVLNAQDPIVGSANTYKINLVCKANCTLVAAILEIEANKVEAAEEAEATETEASKATETEEKTEVDAQAKLTAPEVPSAQPVPQAIRTGVVVSATGEVVHQQTLNTADSLEQNVSDMMSFVEKKKNLNMIK